MLDWRREIERRLAALHLAPEREAEIAEEVAQHAEDRFSELRSQGLSEPAAREVVRAELDADPAFATAVRAYGRSDRTDAPQLGTDRSRWFANLAQDIRYGIRALRARPAFAAVTLLTLTLGIGANTALFGVVDGVLLRPLPYHQPDRLATFWFTAPERGLAEVSLTQALFVFYRDETKTFESLAAYEDAGVTLTSAGDAERVDAANVSREFFHVFGVRPLLGRDFLPREDTPKDNSVAILSYALWQRRFGGDSSLVGRVVAFNERPTTVVGIMPPSFDFPKGAEVWRPIGMDPQHVTYWYLSTVGRLKPGVAVGDAGREMVTLMDVFKRRHPEWFPHDDGKPSRVVAVTLRDRLVGDVRRPLLILFGAVGVVLLIACANIANLLLARAASRRREMALRCCLGASPRRIAAQLLTESLLLAFGGALGGMVLAAWATGAMQRELAGRVPLVEQMRVDPTLLGFAVLVAIAAGVLFGVAPAFRASRVPLAGALKEGTREGSSGSSRRLTNAFVVVQLALSLVLLAGAGLLLRSFQRLLATDPGFRPMNVVAGRLALPYRRYNTDTLARNFYDRYLARVRAIPGVRAAGLIQQLPFSGGNMQDNIHAEGQEPQPGEPEMVANLREVTPGYFEAIGTPLLEGRGFTETDDGNSVQVAIVDETLARRYWPNADAIGKRIRRSPKSPWLTIVGIVPNVKHRSLNETPNLWVYVPVAQETEWGNYLVVRSTVAPAAIVTALRRELAAVDRGVPLYNVATMEETIGRSLDTRRLTNVLLTGFATTALLLAAIGMYGVMSLGVGARIREFGVRLALGAQGRDVVRLVLREGAILVALGLGIGLAGAAAVSRVLRGLLFGVQSLDVVTFAAVALVMTVAALTACYLPARRATRADPMLALRNE